MSSGFRCTGVVSKNCTSSWMAPIDQGWGQSGLVGLAGIPGNEPANRWICNLIIDQRKQKGQLWTSRTHWYAAYCCSHKMWGTCSYSRCCNSSLKYENCCRLTYWQRRSIVHRPRWDISPAYSATLMVDLIAPESPPGPNRNLSRSFNFRDGDFQYHNKYK